MQEAIVHNLHRSGWVAQAVQAVLPELPRWERRLRDRGIMYVSHRFRHGPGHGLSPKLFNELNLLMGQASTIRDPSLEHQLRNLTGVRPFKP
jgi:hypothetical protein